MTGTLRSAVVARPAGDAAVLIELAAVIDAEVNARAIAIAEHIRSMRVPGVRDVVPTYRSVAVYFDPRLVDGERLARQPSIVGTVLPGPSTPRQVKIPVAYGGEYGPDLAAVAQWAGLSPEEVVSRHQAATYRVYMLGFLPGFPYMGTVDAGIAAPRRAAPRLAVPGGSVALAGAQTGVYPISSPGGWQIIGRTGELLFDPARDPPALLAPGDEVRFIEGPVSQQHVTRPDPGAGAADAPGAVTVLDAGLFTTVQDAGRWGHQTLGVPVSGTMDWLSSRIANRLVGNSENAALLEATLAGPRLRFETATEVAVAGADLGASLDGQLLRPGTARNALPGSELRFGERRYGARAYIAFSGGIAVDPVLGSRATHTLSGMGGMTGRPVRHGDRLPIGIGSRPSPDREDGAPAVDADWVRQRPAPTRLRVMRGPQVDRFPDAAVDRLTAGRFVVSPQSNRMGYRLSGASVPPPHGEMISDATFTGALQVPPSGEPILLMADRQTTGGYAQLATVITADLPLAAQLSPGDSLEFSVCTLQEARAALAERDRMSRRRV